MNIDPERLATVERLRPKLQKAIERLDPFVISAVLHDPSIKRVEFEPGIRYRLAVMASPVDPKPSFPGATDSPHLQVSKLLGWDQEQAIRDAGVLEVTGHYRGRLPMTGYPHAFTLQNGQSATLGDMDIVGWEIAK